MVKKEARKNLEILLAHLPEKKIEKLKLFMENGELSEKSDIYELNSKLNLTSQESKLVRKTLKDFPTESGFLISLDLITELQKIKNENESKTSLVWTSPIIFNEKADNTSSTMREMINSSVQRITLVGYVIQPNTSEIFETLIQASKRGVKVRLIFNKAETYLKYIIKMWQDKVPLPIIYSYNPVMKGTSLHAKVLIIDSLDILITSANLTSFGIHQNVEMGIRHQGNPAKNAEELIETLIKQNHLVRLKW